MGLVLTLHKGRRIKVGEAWISLHETAPNQVKIQFDAPPAVSVVREELLERDARRDS